MEAINITELRKNTKSTLDRVVDNSMEIIVHRANSEDVVLVPLDEYNSLKETLFLLSSEKNRDRLNKGMEQVNNGQTTKVSIDEL
ncbi:MAG: type II toxin-antitoxin system prevent-host-death family antitoxin [Bacteroidota bacterium]